MNVVAPHLSKFHITSGIGVMQDTFADISDVNLERKGFLVC